MLAGSRRTSWYRTQWWPPTGTYAEDKNRFRSFDSAQGRPEALEARAESKDERMTMMTRSSACIAGVLVVMCACMCAAVAQTGAADMSEAQGILPSGLGDAIDRDVAKVRDA